MFPALNTAVSGLQQFQQEIDVLGNNIANVNTTGFKAGRTEFEDAFSQALSMGASAQVGSGVSTAGIHNNFNQGTIESTGAVNDLAIAGQGFFVVKNTIDNSEYATRAGDFHLDANGYLVTNGGLRVQGYNDTALSTIGDIKVDLSTVASDASVPYTIDTSGHITVNQITGSTVQGQILLQNYRDPSALIKQGANLYSAPAAAGPLAALTAPQTNGVGQIKSGSLEASNVDLTGEMTSLITAERAFQANAKIITTSDEVLQELVNLKR